ncbi:hypothetical protein [Methylobacterium sp. SD274]|nr:hypothetical protein [Methylobacterium sp. SD274]
MTSIAVVYIGLLLFAFLSDLPWLLTLLALLAVYGFTPRHWFK